MNVAWLTCRSAAVHITGLTYAPDHRSPFAHLLSAALLALLQAPAQAASVPAWGDKSSVPIDTPIEQLKKGEFLWMGEAVSPDT